MFRLSILFAVILAVTVVACPMTAVAQSTNQNASSDFASVASCPKIEEPCTTGTGVCSGATPATETGTACTSTVTDTCGAMKNQEMENTGTGCSPSTSTGSNYGAGPSTENMGTTGAGTTPFGTAIRKIARPQSYGAAAARTRMPKAGVNLGWVSLAGLALSASGFALRRRRS